MTTSRSARKAMGACGLVAFSVVGCAFNGINSLPLPGAVGRGPDGLTYYIDIVNVGTLEPNAPVLVNDVTVGSVDSMRFVDWHAHVKVSIKAGTVIPANAVATIGQTSLLGSMHLALNPPLGQPPSGRLEPNSTIPLSSASTYPSTEQTLSSLSAVVNAGGLGQIGDVIHNLNTALSGRETDVRDLLNRLNDVVGVLDDQKDNINQTIDALGRLSAKLAGQTDVIDRLVKALPPALEVLNKERPRLVTALDKLGGLSDLTAKLVDATQQDLVTNLQNLEPTLRALADVGKEIDTAIGYATTFPFTQNLIDRGLHGDYMNEWAIVDLTIPRLKRTLFLGTRWGDPDAKLVPAPGDPYYQRYTYDPVGTPLAPPALPPDAPSVAPPDAAPPDASGPMPPVTGPILPVQPPALGADAPATAPDPSQIFAGPYTAAATATRTPVPPAPETPAGGG